MPLQPRRWFQFSLSTWFVLVAILAWAMVCRWPLINNEFGEAHWRLGSNIVRSLMAAP